MTTGVRFAIRMATDAYSNGPQQRGVPLNKAKLWTNIGHLKNHLHGMSNPYHRSATVVEIEVVYKEKEVGLVSDIVDDAKRKQTERQREQEIAHARYELKAAEKRLKEAQQNARRKGIR